MTLFRALLALLALAAAVAMGVAVWRILGPDHSFPPRGWWFDAKWITFHMLPCLAIAGMAIWSRRGDRLGLIKIAVVGTLILLPGVWVAWDEANSREDHGRMYGLQTAAAVLLQYLLVLALAAVLLWRSRVERRKNPKQQTTSRDGIHGTFRIQS